MPTAMQVRVSKTGAEAISLGFLKQQIGEKLIGVKCLNLLRPFLHMAWGQEETTISCPVKNLANFSKPWINRPLDWCFTATVHLKLGCRVRPSRWTASHGEMAGEYIKPTLISRDAEH